MIQSCDTQTDPDEAEKTSSLSASLSVWLQTSPPRESDMKPQQNSPFFPQSALIVCIPVYDLQQLIINTTQAIGSPDEETA